MQMEQIPDHPVVRCMERTGYPPWYGASLRTGGRPKRCGDPVPARSGTGEADPRAGVRTGAE